jgi:hypothetical protein
VLDHAQFLTLFRMPTYCTVRGLFDVVARAISVEAGSQYGDSEAGGIAFLLCPGLEARLEHCGDTVSEEGVAPPASNQPTGGRTSDRCSRDAFSPHPADDAVCHCRPSRRGGSLGALSRVKASYNRALTQAWRVPLLFAKPLTHHRAERQLLGQKLGVDVN